MRAIRIHAYGETPRVEDIPVTGIGPEEVLVRVEAAALNPLDALVVSGHARQFFDITLPITIGTDFAGTIERVGMAVTRWRPGDAVVGWADAGTGGALADYVAIPAAACAARPASLSPAEASGIPTAGITAWHALFSTGRLTAGETVLIHAAAGGVGTFAVQFAHAAGARVIATASGDGVALARDLGADVGIDHRTQDFVAEAGKVDLVLDLVGGETQARSYAVLRPGGRLVSAAMPPDPDAASAHGVEARMFYAKPFADRLAELVETIAGRGLKVTIDRIVPIDDFYTAWRHLTARRARGKIVVSL